MDNGLKKLFKDRERQRTELDGFYWIDPPLAELMLKRNVANPRDLKPAIVKQYSEDMKNRCWDKTGDTIKFDVDGNLADGQHRLEGIKSSGVGAWSYIVFDVPKTNKYDQQYKRSAVMRLKDIQANSLMPAIANIVLASTIGEKVGVGISDAYVREHQDLLRKASQIVSVGGKKDDKVAKKAACGAIAYMFLRTKEIPEEEIAEFFSIVNTLTTKEMNRHTSAAIILAKQLKNTNWGTGRLSQRKQLEITYRALEVYHENVIRSNYYSGEGHRAVRLIERIKEEDAKLLSKAA